MLLLVGNLGVKEGDEAYLPFSCCPRASRTLLIHLAREGRGLLGLGRGREFGLRR